MRWLLVAVVAALDLVAAIWLRSVFALGLWLVGAIAVLLVIGVNVAALRARASALRWLLPTLALMLAFGLAPVVYTAVIATTNYSGVHLLTQQQAIAALERQTFIPDSGRGYDWAAYESSDGELALYLIPKPSEDGDGEETSEHIFVIAGGETSAAKPNDGIFGRADEEGFPETIDGWERLDRVQMVTRIGELTDTEFGTPPETFHVLSPSRAASVEAAYEIDSGTGVVTDRQTGVEYTPSSDGFFTSADGERLRPAFQTFIGFDNVVTLFTNDSIRGPFLQILVWTIIFAIAVVTVQLALGMLYAVVLNSRAVPAAAARAIRAVLLLPYVIPAYLMILTWAAMLNQQTGLVPDVVERLFGADPSWVGTGNGARLAMLAVGVWLGFPYFLLINTGALQAIPDELIEAASVDGASATTRFFRIILPLLLRMITPLIVLALAFNFNNFLIAYLLFEGGPPQPGAQVPAGETDLLISFTYKLSFDFGGSQYALAAVVTVLIFLSLTPIVLSQMRYFSRWQKAD